MLPEQHRVHPADQRARFRREVAKIVFDANYIVMGLGDVYLGAPVATPLDPRRRLVTTKYNPPGPGRPKTPSASAARTCAFTEWRGLAATSSSDGRFRCGTASTSRRSSWRAKPYLLRFFDQVRFFPVEADELLKIRRDLHRGEIPYPHGRERVRYSGI